MIFGSLMNVVHVIIGLNVGGAELMLKRLVLNSKNKGAIRHNVISLTDLGSLGNEISDNGVPVYCLNAAGYLSGVNVFFKLIFLMRRLKPDVVHTWMYHSDFIGGIAARLLGVRKVVWCVRSTNLDLGVGKFTPLIRKICAILSHVIPDVIVFAADRSRLVHEKIGYSKRKSLVIPNGFDVVDLDFKSRLNNGVRGELGLSENDFIVVSIGRFNPVKNHKLLIDAASKVLAGFDNAKFLLVGRDLDQNNHFLLECVSKTPCPDAFYLLGERFDVPSILTSSDLFCLHSSSEGFPNVLGEAMSLAVPSISTDVGDAAFLLGDVRRVCPPDEVDALYNLFVLMLSMSFEKRQELGAQGRNRILKNFSLERVVDRYECLYLDGIKG